MARELKTSRSAVIATALAEYLGKRSARRLLVALDAAYDDEMAEEIEASRRMVRQQRRAPRDN